MSTVTYTLINGETITIADTELDAHAFLDMVIDKGMEIDAVNSINAQVESIHISYRFPKDLMITKEL